MDHANIEIDEPELYRDAPVSLQLIGRPCEDEKVCAPVKIFD